MKNSLEIEEIAADWLAKRDSGRWSDADEAGLNTWLNAATSHWAAYIRLRAAWQQASRLKAVGAGASMETLPTSEQQHLFSPLASSSGSIPAKPSSVPLRAKRIPWAIAATALLAVAGLALAIRLLDRTQYSTPVGGLTTVPLADGSQVTLNTNSVIRVDLTDTERHIDLKQGEAFFDVAADAARPFVVQAGDRRIVAVGTKFSVRRNPHDVQVIVTEGKVRVEQGAHRRAAPLAAGAIARANDSGVAVQQRPLPEVEEYLKWRSGFMVFQDTALADAVAEFNRYNARRIVIEEPDIGAIRIGGTFRATNVDAFLRILEADFPVRVERAGGRIVLARR